MDLTYGGLRNHRSLNRWSDSVQVMKWVVHCPTMPGGPNPNATRGVTGRPLRSRENLSERRVERQSGVVDSIRKRRAGGVCQVRKTRDMTIRISKRPSETALDMVLAPAIPVTWTKCHNPVVGCAAANHGQPSLTREKTVSIEGI
jgi:hypothetical protein